MTHSLIIGGAGFIGARLARRLSARGEDVTIFDKQAPVDPPEGAEAVTGDLRDLAPGAVRAGPDTTIYLLAAVHRTPGHPEREYFNVNVGGARAVERFAAAAGVRRIVFTSSIAVYGPGEARRDEHTTPRPASPYGWSKLVAEGVLKGWRDASPLNRLIIARPAVVFGPGEGGNFTRLARALKRRLFAFPGRRDTVKGCCYVDDLIDSFDFALARDEAFFLYNFAYPEPYDLSAICDAFARVGGLPRPVMVAPSGLVNLAAWSFEAAARLGWETGVNRARVAKLTQSTHIAPARLTALGYPFRDLDSGLAAWRDEAGSFR